MATSHTTSPLTSLDPAHLRARDRLRGLLRLAQSATDRASRQTQDPRVLELLGRAGSNLAQAADLSRTR